MKLLKFLRYPALLFTIILLPAFLAALFWQLPSFFEQQGWLEATENWKIISSLIGYLGGYYLIYETLSNLNQLLDHTIYSKRIRTTYLIANAITALILLGGLTYSVSILYAGQPLTLIHGIVFIGFPWVSIQMLLLLFFVRSEQLYQ